ncbi:MAG: glycosyltransferase family 1 protein [Candidatus Binatia bacterium]
MIGAQRLTWLQDKVTSPRHVCIVTETYPPEVNGVALTLSHLAAGMRLRGHTVSIVCPRQRKVDKLHYRSDDRVTRVPGLPLPGYRGLQIGLPVGGRLRDCWSDRRPNVVYVATQGPLGWSAVRTARDLEIPVLSGFHTNFHSYCNYYHAGWLHILILRYLRSFHNRTRRTLVPNPDLSDRLQAVGFKDVAVLGRGVDCRLFTPERRSPSLRRQWGASEDDPVALYVGRLAPEKNLSLAIESYRAMQRVNKSIKFVIVGDGPQRAALQKQNSDLIFCGAHTGEELAKRYASADLFLFPSETETFGNVTLEAMASGLVVVAYDYAAAHAHIADGETGVLIPYGSARDFVGAAVKLAGEPQGLAKMRRQAREHAISLDWQQVVDRFFNLLMGAVDQDLAASAEKERAFRGTNLEIEPWRPATSKPGQQI